MSGSDRLGGPAKDLEDLQKRVGDALEGPTVIRSRNGKHSVRLVVDDDGVIKLERKNGVKWDFVRDLSV